eukprot:6246682-Alexandrium_andersonii.AAC.1
MRRGADPASQGRALRPTAHRNALRRATQGNAGFHDRKRDAACREAARRSATPRRPREGIVARVH